jgi:hypothetical protein
MPKKKEWSYREWYDANKENLNAARRLRYQEDKKYREGMQISAREAYRNKRKKAPQPVAGVFKDEKGNTYFTLRIISEITKVSCWVLRNYHKEGVIPPCSLTTRSGWRLYSGAQKEALRKAFALHRDSPKRKEKIKAFLKKRWK